MAYILVSADFPGVTAEQRDEIYRALKKANWQKVTEFGRDISTTWYASFKEGASESGAIQTTKNNFTDCSSPYCKPKLVIHFGPSKPSFHGLS
jgi:hypothetical protein